MKVKYLIRLITGWAEKSKHTVHCEYYEKTSEILFCPIGVNRIRFNENIDCEFEVDCVDSWRDRRQVLIVHLKDYGGAETDRQVINDLREDLVKCGFIKTYHGFIKTYQE